MRKFLLLLVGVCIFFTNLWAQRTVTGRVTDEKGTPLSNVSVQVKGSNTGTVTNAEGIYSLSLPANARTLVFSSVGMATQETSIDQRSSFDMTLRATDQALDEVVVVAYGTAKKSTFTGSAGQINAAEIQRRPITNVTRAIEGAIPGVITTAGSGQPGNGTSIRVRGFGSINATQDPLFVVDGVPYIGGTSNINPDDIENITVLKDAASTALYGSRAANGVIMITTKRGQKGRNNVYVKISQGVATRGLPEYDRIDAFQYYPIMWEAYRNSLVYPATGTGLHIDSANKIASGLMPRITSGSNAGLQSYGGRTYSDISQLLSYNPFNVPSTSIVGTNGQLNPNAQLLYADDLDWTRELMRNGSRRDYAVNLNGGAEKSDYFLSLGYLDEGGYTLNTDFRRFSGRLNVNVQPKSWLRTGLNISGNHTNSNTARDGGSTNFVNPFFFSRTVGPIYPVFAHDMNTGAYALDPVTGERIWDLGNFGSTPIGTQYNIPNRPSGAHAGRHVLAETSLNEQLYKRTVASARNNTDITFLKNFKFTNTIAVDFQNQYDASYDNNIVGDGAPAGRTDRETGFVTGFLTNQLLNYGNAFGRHRVDGLVGHESFNQIEEGQRGFKQGQALPGFTELTTFTTVNAATSYTDRYRIESYFSRFNYDFDGKYLVSASVRRDGNSRFSPQSRWGTFWSVGAGWRLDKENFMSNVSFINALKLRGSYGVVGVADGIGFYAWQGLYGFANNANEPGIIQSQTAFENPELTWEKNVQADIGLEFGFFKNRISGAVEYYHRESRDLLFAVPRALSSGILSTLQNTATMFNRGFEFQLSGDVVRNKNFTWNMNFNASTITNQITKMPESVSEFVTGTKKYAVGRSIFDYWLRTYYGVDPSDGSALYWADNRTTADNRRIISNKDGGKDTLTTSINNAKFEYQGSTLPDLYGSFSPTFTYKQISLNVLFTFQLGGQTYDALYAALMSAGTYGGALHTDILRRWQKPGDTTDVPRMDAGRTADHNAQSSRWLTKASFLNLRSFNVSYNLPKSITSRVKVNSSQFFISGENLHFFTKRKGMNNQQASSGVTSNAYPPATVISAGLNLNF